MEQNLINNGEEYHLDQISFEGVEEEIECQQDEHVECEQVSLFLLVSRVLRSAETETDRSKKI